MKQTKPEFKTFGLGSPQEVLKNMQEEGYKAVRTAESIRKAWIAYSLDLARERTPDFARKYGIEVYNFFRAINSEAISFGVKSV